MNTAFELMTTTANTSHVYSNEVFVKLDVNNDGTITVNYAQSYLINSSAA